MTKKIIFIIAGEKSGDKLGAELISNLKVIDKDIVFLGVGGALMKAQGVESLFDIEELSVMGIVEILPKLRKLIYLRNMLVTEVILCQPICVITIDSPDFCLRVSKKVKKINPNIKTIHYVAPSLWAWRASRGFRIAKFVDYILALFPFEPKVMEKYGIPCKFVGHPISSINPSINGEERIIRKCFKVNEKRLLIVLLPGSREAEVRRLLPIFLKSLEILREKIPDFLIIIPTPKAVTDLVKRLVKDAPINIELCLEDASNINDFELQKSKIFSAADFAIAASGTVTLELAAYNTPMVVGYDVNWISRVIIKTLLKIKYVSLVNIILDRQLVPELIGRNFKSDLIAEQVQRLVCEEKLLLEQRSGLIEVMRILKGDRDQGTYDAANAVYNLLSDWRLV